MYRLTTPEQQFLPPDAYATHMYSANLWFGVGPSQAGVQSKRLNGFV